jgi:endonuclease YncB( thermonuclease family)
VSLDRPRRIFRSCFPRLEGRGVAAVIGVGLVAAAGVSLAMLPGRDALRPGGGEEVTAEPEQVVVIDGGTLRLAGRVVRLRGVDPPSHSMSCSGEDCGAAATNALAAMVREAPVSCRTMGADDLGRALAVCQARGTELNLAIVAAGWARADSRDQDFMRAEATAQAEKRGVWAHDRSW